MPRRKTPLARDCVVCGKPLTVADATGTSKTHRGKCRETNFREQQAEAKRRWRETHRPTRKPKLPRTPGAPLEPRKTRMNQSAVVNEWGNDYVIPVYQPITVIAVIQTNQPGVTAQLLDCPYDVDPCSVSLRGRANARGCICWSLRINGRRITEAKRNKWSHEMQSFSYKIKEEES